MDPLSSGEKVNTVSKDQSRNYNGVDLFKFICAIMVFIIHIPPFQGEVSPLFQQINFGLQSCICRIAVPFFFVCSGFFLFRKMPFYEINSKAVTDYCLKLLRLFGIWYVLLFVGGTGHLWYLRSTVVAVVLLCLCSRLRIPFGSICLIACLLYVVGLLGNSYFGFIRPLTSIKVFEYALKGYRHVFITTRNGVFMGFIFVLMGAAFSRFKIKLKPKASLLGLSASIICLVAEAFLLEYYGIPFRYDMYISSLPATFFLFSLSLSIPLKDRPIYKRLRNIGVIFYFSHILIDKFVSVGLRILGRLSGIELIGFEFVLSMICCLLFAAFAEWLSRKEKLKWLNLLIS